MKRKQEDTEQHVKRIRTDTEKDTTVFPFYTLPYDLKYHIAGFLLDFTDDGFEDPKEDIKLLVKCIWGGTNPSKYFALQGLAWPEKVEPEPRFGVSVYDAARRGNMPLMKHLIAAKEFKKHDTDPYKGAMEFGHVPHLEWLLDFEPSEIVHAEEYFDFRRHDGSRLDQFSYYALKRIHKSMVSFIMSQETYSKLGLICSAICCGSVPIAEMFLSWGWDFSFLNRKQFPIIRAHDSAPMLSWLVKKGMLRQPSESRLIRLMKNDDWLMTFCDIKWYCSHFDPTSKVFHTVFRRMAVKYGDRLYFYSSLKWMFDEGFPYDRKKCVEDSIWSRLLRDQ